MEKINQIVDTKRTNWMWNWKKKKKTFTRYEKLWEKIPPAHDSTKRNKTNHKKNCGRNEKFVKLRARTICFIQNTFASSWCCVKTVWCFRVSKRNFFFVLFIFLFGVNVCALPSISFCLSLLLCLALCVRCVQWVSTINTDRDTTHIRKRSRSRSGKLHSIQLYGHRLCRQYPITAFIASASVVFGTLRLDAFFFSFLSLFILYSILHPFCVESRYSDLCIPRECGLSTSPSFSFSVSLSLTLSIA